jgi:zinc D-Ala-D-Ala carboxypeptidase
MKNPRHLVLKPAFLLAICITVSGFQTPAESPGLNELIGKFEPSAHPDFVAVDIKYCSRSGLYLRKEVMAAFSAMHDAADSAGIRLTILSATRNFNYQKGIWEKKWARPSYSGWTDAKKAHDILTYSSMPGTSRHHWGTDFDLNSLDPAYFKTGQGKKIYTWLVANAVRFGFCQTYSPKVNGRTGYEEEPWHWSYFPLSVKYLEAYNALVSYDDLTGFSGSATAKEIGVIEYFVNGVECKMN